MFDRTPAERLDHALDRLLPGSPARAGAMVTMDDEIRPLIVTAERLHDALAPVPVSARFERRLERRLSTGRWSWPAHSALPQLRGWRGGDVPAWLVLTGAISSVAVGAGVTVAVWRSSRRTATARPGRH